MTPGTAGDSRGQLGTLGAPGDSWGHHGGVVALEWSSGIKDRRWQQGQVVALRTGGGTRDRWWHQGQVVAPGTGSGRVVRCPCVPTSSMCPHVLCVSFCPLCPFVTMSLLSSCVPSSSCASLPCPQCPLAFSMSPSVPVPRDEPLLSRAPSLSGFLGSGRGRVPLNPTQSHPRCPHVPSGGRDWPKGRQSGGRTPP